MRVGQFFVEESTSLGKDRHLVLSTGSAHQPAYMLSIIKASEQGVPFLWVRNSTMVHKEWFREGKEKDAKELIRDIFTTLEHTGP